MNITVNGTPKEITELICEMQNSQKEGCTNKTALYIGDAFTAPVTYDKLATNPNYKGQTSEVLGR